MENQIQKFETNDALIAQQRAEMDVQIVTAKQYPRDLPAVIDNSKVMIATTPEIAAACNYSLTKGGKIISGPSIRLAEIVMNTWGNLHVGSRITGEDDHYIYVQGAAHDLQSNVKFVSDVKRRITKTNGQKYSPDMVQTTAAAASAIAVRNAVFKVVPSAFIMPLSEYAKTAARGKKENIKTRIENALIHFRDVYDVSPEAICLKLEVDSVEKIKSKQLDILLGIATALQDKQTSIENEFPNPLLEPQGLSEKGEHDFSEPGTAQGDLLGENARS